jgi:hypothetical protein
MENPIDGTGGKLGRGFMSADKLEEIDIGDGDKASRHLSMLAWIQVSEKS